ncbi:tetratricopeptide repeat protein [Sunxiuqinia sp. A32]|uniref:tetratricopeptide repeat protein n=1 Tax=Sunxiuqinia sp. A32 TaxID=3461496 RepID=UPI004045335D
MKARRFLLIIFVCCLSGITLAQQTSYYPSLIADVQKAKELFNKNKFIAAQQQFEKIDKQADKGSEIQSEARYYQALCALRLENENSEYLVEQFIQKNPESPYSNRALFELGSYHFNEGHYGKLLSTYRKLRPLRLTKEEQVKVHYQVGYSYFQTDRLPQAEVEFSKIKDTNNLYADPAKYYWAHIKYLQEDYNAALDEFKKLEDNPAFAGVIPFYISQIYYKQEKYAEVVEFTIPLLETAKKDQKAGLEKIIGNSYFHLKQFDKAIPHLEYYFAESNSKLREENYMLGYCYYMNQQYAKAIEPLENASKGKDELAQNAYYHLADCYIKDGKHDKAKFAFEAASELDFNAEIKEDALFNFAKITYELSYSPFNETIKAFDKYISLYPNSERNDAAYDYLVNVYMSTSNYRDAIASIEKIQVKSTSIKKAYQRVTFYRGLELFNNLDYRGANQLFDTSLKNGQYDSNLKAAAIYWKAEANYRLEEYNTAINGFNQFLKTPGAISLPEYQTVHYNLAYSYFKLNDYKSSLPLFEKFISNNIDDRSEKLADAYNRLGDCYFIDRDYRNAIKSYESAYQLKSYDPDYSLFQKAICLGIDQEQEQKISTLRTLVQTYQKSAMIDDALYELGRACERNGQSKVASGYYSDLLQEHPQSVYRPKALLQLGLINYNSGEFKQSMTYYKQVVEQYPESEESQAALLGIKNNYVEMNNVDGYFAYTKRLGSGVQISVSEQDSLSYLAAEKLYMSRSTQAKEQLEKYLRLYPSGSFAINAHFYLGELRYQEKQFSLALNDYEYVLDQSDNIFTEPALSKASELQYNAANYHEALTYFERLEKTSNTKWNLLKARAGKMRCYYELANYEECIKASKSLLSSDKLTDILKREANFKLAKSYYHTNQQTQALPVLGTLAEDTKSMEGAEAKYLIAEILTSQNKLQNAEEEIMDFISKNTPHQFWLAKSFILLSDIYLSQGDEFQALHTIKSIVENYPIPDDGIVETATAKLNHLEKLQESQQQQQGEPMKIDINQQ